jgi:hypothetical protein
MREEATCVDTQTNTQQQHAQPTYLFRPSVKVSPSCLVWQHPAIQPSMTDRAPLFHPSIIQPVLFQLHVQCKYDVVVAYTVHVTSINTLNPEAGFLVGYWPKSTALTLLFFSFSQGLELDNVKASAQLKSD